MNNIFLEQAIKNEERIYTNSKILYDKFLEQYDLQRRKGLAFSDRIKTINKIDFFKSKKKGNVNLLDFEIWEGIDDEIKRFGIETFVWIYKDIIYKTT